MLARAEKDIRGYIKRFDLSGAHWAREYHTVGNLELGGQLAQFFHIAIQPIIKSAGKIKRERSL